MLFTEPFENYGRPMGSGMYSPATPPGTVPKAMCLPCGHAFDKARRARAATIVRIRAL